MYYMKLISIRLDERMVSKIDEVARKTLMSRSEVVRNSIAIYLSLLENIGFYFKPSLPVRNVDVYEERNAINIDLGNLTSVTVMSVSYGGVGELDGDLRKELSFVAEVMANQIAVESICRFVTPLLVMLSTTCGFEYSYRFFRHFSERVRVKLGIRTTLAGCEEVFETQQSGFVATLVGLRDMSVKNSPRRGDGIFFYGRDVAGESLRKEDLVDTKKVRELAELVRKGEATSILPVKSGGLREAVTLAASLAGGRAVVEADRRGSPATAVILTSPSDLSRYGCERVGEIL